MKFGFASLTILLVALSLSYFYIDKTKQESNRKEFMAEKKRALLPSDVIPSVYHLHLTPDVKQFTFDGHERIEVEVKRETNVLTIHCLDIKISTVSFQSNGGSSLTSTEFSYNEKEETVAITFPSALKQGQGVLEIKYQGNLNKQMIGFYRSKYFVDGEERYMATTQMEPTGARRAFPGWDEPALKAKFNITLSFPEHLQGLSNMLPIKESVADGVKTIAFDTTPIMSTYLVAFVVGEFEYVEAKTKEGTNIRVFTPLGKKEQGRFSLDVGVRCLSYYNDYYGIPYPLPKLDMIAIADFAAGAMENWGLVTYRETALLIDPQTSGVATKQRVAYVVAHELAHQWFGNLVTMEWWQELWLNEGFATFVGNQAIFHLFPEWDIWTQFIKDYMNRALELDALENSHPIEVEVESSAQIEEIFDAISYCKGAAVIRMIADLLGEEKFRKGLNIYLNRHKYSNAVTEDLWRALSEASGFSVNQFMDKYTKVTGFPLVSISSTENPAEFQVEQTRFYASGKTVQQDQPWWVSVGVRTSDSKEVTKVDLKEHKSTVKFPVNAQTKFFKANADQSGFYRIKYSSDISAKISTALTELALPTVDRIGIQNDAFALAKACLIRSVDALTLAQAYHNETDSTVWADLAISLGAMGNVWDTEPEYPLFQKFVVKLFKKIGTELGWDKKEGESDLNTLLRTTVLNQLGSNGDADTVAEAKKRFAARETTAITPDLRFFVYKTVVGKGGEQEWNQVLNIFKTADAHEEKLRALRALGSTQDDALLSKTLNMALDGQVREQDIFYVILACGAHPKGREATWAYLKQNWAQFEEKLGETAMILDRLVTYATTGFSKREVADDIRQFFQAHPCESADRSIRQAIENTLANAKWVDENRAEVAEWLKKQ
eukprot:TRINITY_DN181_c0_g2_i1.p1 TRINITY_DN181_c0_g2~~TRINITY_DN181_c0_g2_i1.p1  ORF type:complete len:891 (-),score=308.06 TRINITY_DN181_c0_g2_i1:1031-3703(-)